MRGAKTGLITTRGHGDAILIMRSYGRSAGLPIERLLHVSRHRKPDPIVPPSRIKEVSERLDYAGDVFLPLNEDEVREAIEALVADGVEAIAIAFLWGFVNPVHELRVKELVQELAPDVFISCAHELIAKPGEYERTAAAAINAFIGPSTANYVEEVDRATTERGYRQPLLIMQAAGGVVPAEHAAGRPLFTIGSGPVGGVTGAAYLAALMGHENVIAGDVGGTSYDVGIIADGEPLAASETVINQYTFFMPRLDIESIGSGGGSIVWVDEHSRTLRVGPESAGALPGPACYGRGGERPTVTDCDLVLGRYNPDAFLGGELTPGRGGARAGRWTSVAGELGMDPVEAADGALRIVETQMADLMRQMTVERGRDPRDFVVYAFGGGGGARAVEFARELGCSQVVVPLGDLASTWSALGVMSSDVLHVHEHSELVPGALPVRQAERDLRASSRPRRASSSGARASSEASRSSSRRFADMKFSMQIHQVEVPVPGGHADRRGRRGADRPLRGALRADLRPGLGILRRRARRSASSGCSPAAGCAPRRCPRSRSGRPRPPESREVYWRDLGGFHATDVFPGHALGAGFSFEGPCILDLPDTTVVVPPGASGRVDQLGSIVIDVGAPPGQSTDGAIATAARN